MALKRLLKDEAEWKKLPESLQGEYVKNDDGTFQLDTDDDDMKKKLDEFRTNNRALLKEKERLGKEAAKFKDIDPEAYAEAMEAKKKLEDLENANLAKAGNIDEVVAKRTETMRTDYEKKLKAKDELLSSTEAARTKYRDSLRNQKIAGTIRDAVTKAGNVRPGAMTDILNRALNQWQLNDQDELVAPDLFDDKGEPMSPEVWSKRLVTESPYLFEPAQGGGASGGQKGVKLNNGKTIRNPSPMDYGKGTNLEDIASGKLKVEFASNDEEM